MSKASRVTGLAHLQEALFTEAAAAADSGGLQFLEAAGATGEARLVARQARQWRDNGAESIIIVHRDWRINRNMLDDTFAQYGLALEFPERESLAGCGALRLLRHAWSLPELDFPFRDVTAIWRNSYFRPAFEADLPLKSDLLLRLVEVPKGQENFLEQIRIWADKIAPAPLEDQSMEVGDREELSKLAKRCLGFANWFFALWDAIPASASPGAMVKACETFADELGLFKAPLPMAEDAAAIGQFWKTLQERAKAAKRKTVTKAEFAIVLKDVLEKTPWPGESAPDAIRVVPPEQALPCTHLLFMGLGEGSFPRLGDDPDQYDVKLQAERAIFKLAVASASREVLFSYAALDAKGQSLLPSTFLRDVSKCFLEVPVARQVMPLDRYFLDEPLSPAEKRAQYAKQLTNPQAAEDDLPASMVKHLKLVQAIGSARFGAEPSRFSGTIADAGVKSRIATRFGPEKPMSPTALETYIACPFKYWAKHVLKIEAAEEPEDGLDVGERGTALHRMLARYHARKPEQRPDSQWHELDREWEQAADEVRERTPSPPGKVLWSLEARRMRRALARYPQHWAKFLGDWQPLGLAPVPNRFEAPFDLPLEIDGVRFRFFGTVDRVDAASLDDGLGFWIIDYKTGGTAYSAVEVANFERVQLPLYALAVERSLFQGVAARPLGLVYWLVAKDGPKKMLPAARKASAWAEDAEAWPSYREQLLKVLAKVVRAIRSADFRLAPRRDKTCEYCDYRTACRINQQRGNLTPLPLVEPAE